MKENDEETEETDISDMSEIDRTATVNAEVDNVKEDDADNRENYEKTKGKKKGGKTKLEHKKEVDSGKEADDEYEDTDANNDVPDDKTKHKLSPKQPQIEDVETSDVDDGNDDTSGATGDKKRAPAAKKAPVKPKSKPTPKEAAPKDSAPKDATPLDVAPKDATPKDVAPKESIQKKSIPKESVPDESIQVSDQGSIQSRFEDQRIELEEDKTVSEILPASDNVKPAGEEEATGDTKGVMETDVADKSTIATTKEDDNEEDQYYQNLDAEGQALYNELQDQAAGAAEEEAAEDDFNLYFSSDEEPVVEEVKVVERKKIIKQKLVILPGRYYKYKRTKGATEERGVAAKWRPGAPVPQLDPIKINEQVLAHMNRQDKRMREREMPSLDFRPGVTPAKPPTENVKDYFAKHKIFELCNFLMGAVLKQVPDCPLDFMINIVHEINGQRGLIKAHGGSSSVPGECHLTPRDNDIANMRSLHATPSEDKRKEVTSVQLGSISEPSKQKGKKGKGKMMKKGNTREASLTRVEI